MNVKILFTFQVIFIYKSYWLLIFKSEKDKSYSFMGVHGMLVVPNCWDVGTWGWLERKIEILFYEWTHLFSLIVSPWHVSSTKLLGHWNLRMAWKENGNFVLWMDTLIYWFRRYYGHLALQMDIFTMDLKISSPEWNLGEVRKHWN